MSDRATQGRRSGMYVVVLMGRVRCRRIWQVGPDSRLCLDKDLSSERNSTIESGGPVTFGGTKGSGTNASAGGNFAACRLPQRSSLVPRC